MICEQVCLGLWNHAACKSSEGQGMDLQPAHLQLIAWVTSADDATRCPSAMPELAPPVCICGRRAAWLSSDFSVSPGGGSRGHRCPPGEYGAAGQPDPPERWLRSGRKQAGSTCGAQVREGVTLNHSELSLNCLLWVKMLSLGLVCFYWA